MRGFPRVNGTQLEDQPTRSLALICKQASKSPRSRRAKGTQSTFRSGYNCMLCQQGKVEFSLFDKLSPAGRSCPKKLLSVNMKLESLKVHNQTRQSRMRYHTQTSWQMICSVPPPLHLHMVSGGITGNRLHQIDTAICGEGAISSNWILAWGERRGLETGLTKH